MKKLFLLIAMLSSLSAFGQYDENPGSLWNDHGLNPMTMRTAHGVGDILTVIISEISSATFSATTTTSKKDNTSVGSPNIPLLGSLIRDMGYSANSSTNGTGSTQQVGNLIARLTVVVKRVLPNGNLVIEGARRINVNKDQQIVRLTGVVRADDVTAENTVLSERIAEAEIKTEGKGQIADRQRQGILTRLLSFLF